MVCLQEAECEKLRMDAKYEADTKIADSARLYQMQKANFDMEVNARVCWPHLTIEIYIIK